MKKYSIVLFVLIIINTTSCRESLSTTSTPLAVSVETGYSNYQEIDGWIQYWNSTPVEEFSFSNKEGIIWMGWRGKVVELFSESAKYNEYTFEQPYHIYGIAFDSSGNLWLGGPIIHYFGGEWTLYDSQYTLPMSISNDTIWTTSSDINRSDCVVRYEEEIWKEFCPDFSNAIILDLEIDEKSNLWISFRDESFFNQGVWELNDKGWNSIKELEGTNMSSPFQIAQSHDGKLWFVSAKHNESLVNGEIRVFDGVNWILSIENTEMVSKIEFSPDNLLWGLASDNRENYLIRFEDNKWEKVLSENDLAKVFGESVDIYSFGFNQVGKLCVGTSLGLVCSTT